MSVQHLLSLCLPFSIRCDDLLLKFLSLEHMCSMESYICSTMKHVDGKVHYLMMAQGTWNSSCLSILEQCLTTLTQLIDKHSTHCERKVSGRCWSLDATGRNYLDLVWAILEIPTGLQPSSKILAILNYESQLPGGMCWQEMFSCQDEYEGDTRVWRSQLVVRICKNILLLN